MNLKPFITPLLKFWWLILASAIIAGTASYFVARQQPPIYQTQTTLMIGRTMFEANPTSTDLWLGQQLANYYADIGLRGEVRNKTQEALGLSWLPQYAINPLPNSQLLEIIVIDSNPERAQAVANELANQLIQRSPTSNQQLGSERQSFIDEQITYLEGKIRDTLAEIDTAETALTEMNSARQIANAQTEIAALQEKLSQLQGNYAALIANTDQGALNTLSVIERAPLPGSPIGPNNMITVIMASLVAMGIAAAAAYLLDFIDDSIKTDEDVNTLFPAPMLGNISTIIKGEVETNSKQSPLLTVFHGFGTFFPKKQKKGVEVSLNGNDDDVYIVASKYPRSSVAEEFRSLRINLEFAAVDKPLKTILVTSPSPAEGKTSVATNLAIVMAQGGKKVILIDADFRKPSINLHFKISNKRGLSNIFRENMDPQDVFHYWTDKILWIITTGKTPPNPVDLLSSQRMNQILDQLKEKCDVIIIDGPPIMFPDTLALSTKVDGVLIVMRHAQTRRGIAQRRCKELTQVGARILGIVINKTPGWRSNYYNKNHYYQYYTRENEVEVEEKQFN